jgi:hypothetical protein
MGSHFGQNRRQGVLILDSNQTIQKLSTKAEIVRHLTPFGVPHACNTSIKKGKTMKHVRLFGLVSFLLLSFLGITGGTAAAQSIKVQGLIKSRSGEDIILNTAEDPNMIVMLTDSTDVGQVEGMLKARSKRMSMAALIPGLAVSVEGDYNGDKVLVATR